jgi:hypothetical protein
MDKVTIGNTSEDTDLKVNGTTTVSGNVGIGTVSPLRPLQVESAHFTSPIGLRTTSESTGFKSGLFTIIPTSDRVYLTFGCYVENDTWKNDPYQLSSTTNNTSGAKLAISRSGGAAWSAYNSSGLAGNNIASWNVAGAVPLWNASGTWTGTARPQIASSTSLSTCNSANAGRIEYQVVGTTGHFWGCVASSSVMLWKQLDNE